MNQYTDKDNEAMALYQAYINGENEAFSKIYDMYVRMLLNYGCCLTTNKELVEDCVHDVFTRLLDRQHAPKMKSMSAFLVISLRNRLIDEFRHDTFSSDQPVEKLTGRKSDMEVERDYITKEQMQQNHSLVTRLMETLTPRQRQAFQLYYLEEMEYKDICQIMDMSYHSIRNLVHRGMLKLRETALATR